LIICCPYSSIILQDGTFFTDDSKKIKETGPTPRRPGSYSKLDDAAVVGARRKLSVEEALEGTCLANCHAELGLANAVLAVLVRKGSDGDSVCAGLVAGVVAADTEAETLGRLRVRIWHAFSPVLKAIGCIPCNLIE